MTFYCYDDINKKKFSLLFHVDSHSFLATWTRMEMSRQGPTMHGLTPTSPRSSHRYKKGGTGGDEVIFCFMFHQDDQFA
jgi:hypothetical protein